MKFGEPVAESSLLAVAAFFGQTSAAWRCLEEAKKRRAAGEVVEYRRGTGRYRDYIFVIGSREHTEEK